MKLSDIVTAGLGAAGVIFSMEALRRTERLGRIPTLTFPQPESESFALPAATSQAKDVSPGRAAEVKRLLLAGGRRQADIARLTGVTQRIVSDIKLGRLHRDVEPVLPETFDTPYAGRVAPRIKPPVDTLALPPPTPISEAPTARAKASTERALTNDKAFLVKQMLRDGVTQVEVARRMRTSQKVISNIALGRTYADVPWPRRRSVT